MENVSLWPRSKISDPIHDAIMTKPMLVAGLAILLALDWAALDDITTGSEPSFFGEWLIVIISIPLLLAAGNFLMKSQHPRNGRINS